jgi:GR25 family glycosyltransferase involved in LPS biosynthesis
MPVHYVSNESIYIITTQKQKEHSIRFVNSFKRPEDHIVIFDAIMNKDPVIGCKESHLQVLKQINDCFNNTGINRINYIFEDDVGIVLNSRPLADEFVKSFLKDADILYLGYCFEQFPKKIKKTNVIKLSTPRCTHAYIIESKNAREFIDLIKNDDVNNPIDEIIGRSIFEGKKIGYGIDLFKQPWQ